MGGFFVLAVAAIALALLAPRVDMTRVIDENSLHADLCQFGMLSPLDRNDIAEYQRRRKLADRPSPSCSAPRCRMRASTTALRAS